MNRKQREKNKETASYVRSVAGTCPECGGRGKHWISLPYSLQPLIDGIPPDGFWTCEKFYGEDGRRLEP